MFFMILILSFGAQKFLIFMISGSFELNVLDCAEIKPPKLWKVDLTVAENHSRKNPAFYTQKTPASPNKDNALEIIFQVIHTAHG